MWLYLALTSAFVYSFRSLVEKISLKSIDKYILAFGLRAFALPLFIIPFILKPTLYIPLSSISISTWVAILFVTVISSPIEIIFFYKALQLSEISTLIPLLSLAPIFTTIFNIIIFKSVPNIYGIGGIMLIVFSVYLLNISKAKEGWLEPFKHLAADKATKYLSVMLLFYALGVVIDKYAITGTNPYYYGLVNYILISSSLLLIALKKSPHQFYQLRKHFWTFTILGIIVFAYTLPRNLAISLGNPGYVAAILSSSVIISTITGLIFLKESNARIKILASLLAFIGLAILKLFT